MSIFYKAITRIDAKSYLRCLDSAVGFIRRRLAPVSPRSCTISLFEENLLNVTSESVLNVTYEFYPFEVQKMFLQDQPLTFGSDRYVCTRETWVPRLLLRKGASCLRGHVVGPQKCKPLRSVAEF